MRGESKYQPLLFHFTLFFYKKITLPRSASLYHSVPIEFTRNHLLLARQQYIAYARYIPNDRKCHRINDTFIGCFLLRPFRISQLTHTQRQFYRRRVRPLRLSLCGPAHMKIDNSAGFSYTHARAARVHTHRESNIYRSIHSFIFNEFQRRCRNNNM